MKGFRLSALGLALAAVVASGSGMAQSDSLARGRAVFDKKGCQHCHSYVSRRGAPAVRDMLRDFEGNPQRVLAGIGSVSEHGEVLRAGSLSEPDKRRIAEWLGADYLPEDETAAADGASDPETDADEPVVKPAAAPAVAAAPALASGPAVPSSVVPAAPLARSAVPAVVSGPALSTMRLQSASAPGGDRLVIELTGGEPDNVDMRIVGDRLIMSFSGVGLMASASAPIVGDSNSPVVRAVTAQADGRTVTVTVEPRDTGWTYSAMQGRRRMVVDFKAEAKPAAAVATTAGQAMRSGKGAAGAAASAAATAGASLAAAAPTTKGAPATKAATKKATKAATKAEPVISDQAMAKAAPGGTASADAARPTTEAASAAPDQPTAPAPAREDGSALAQARAAEQAIAEERAQAAARKREQEKAAQAKAVEQAKTAERAKAVEQARAPVPAVVAKADVQDAAGVSATEPTDRRKRRAIKRPYKEPNLAPCPPPDPADQVIGVVDVERAKDIIDRIGCPQCHAYVQKKTGPPFRDVLKKYKGDPACVIHRLKTNETHKDEGVTADIRPDEFKILADYVATRMK